MKLLTLQLLAYGPFSGRCLDFDSETTAFHVVFGRNEAGKSSSLRALSALLYGVPTRTKDNFLHDHNKLRVGGLLRHSDGAEIAFQRRKGRKNTLLDGDTVLDDHALRRFLAGIDQARFDAVFGIDHDRLAKGARAILSGGGDVGESLFTAGAGTANLREVLVRLDAEADDLYRPRGSKPKINAALATHKTSSKEIRVHSLAATEWVQQGKELQKLVDQRREVADQQAQLKTEATRLERLHAALPKLARRAVTLAKLESLAETVTLAADFPDRRRAAEHTLRQAAKIQGDAERELRRQQADVAGLRVPEALIREQVAVTSLHKELGVFRKAQKDATGLTARRAQSRAHAHTLLDELRPDVNLDDVDTIRPNTSTKARVRELAQQHQAIEAAPTHARGDVNRCERELSADQDALDRLTAPASVTPLRSLVARIRKQGELEATCEEDDRQLAAVEEDAARSLAGLRLWSGTLAACEVLAVPLLDTILRCQDQLVAATSAVDDVRVRIERCEASLADQAETAKALQLSGAVKTEADLIAARARRTADWLQIRHAWLGEPAPAALDAGVPAAGVRATDAAATDAAVEALPASFEGRVEEADEVADRLRREADRVAKFAEVEASGLRLRRELQQLDGARTQAATHSEELTRRWQQLWAPLGITPLSPAEMRAWLVTHSAVVALAKTVREKTRVVQRRRAEIDALRAELSTALAAALASEAAPGQQETLAAGLDRADLIIASATETTRRRAALQEAIPTRTKALDDARRVADAAVTALAVWRTAWAAAVADLGLPAAASPAQANAVLDKLAELFGEVDEARGYEGRLKGIQRDAAAFTAEVDALAERAAADLIGRPTDQTVDVLHDRLAAAKEDAATLQQLKKRIKELTTTIADSEAEQKSAERELRALCSEAGCEEEAALPTAERQSDDKAALSRELLALEDQMAELGGGATVAALVKEASAIDPDTLPAQIEENRRTSGVLDEQRSELDKEIGSEEAAFKRLDGSAAAAEAAATAQAELAKLGTHVERYVRVKLAAELLRAEIERYREENQGPLLKRAGEIFSALTLGSFTELSADYNDKDEAVLVGVRDSAERVHVEGMSQGTADQLYLSLRLATLEQHLASHEPIPFVVDDILVQFDDDRAFAALRVLAELSKKTQVLFFTHHARLVELAQKLGDGAVVVHEL